MEAAQASITRPVVLARQLAGATSELRQWLQDSPDLIPPTLEMLGDRIAPVIQDEIGRFGPADAADLCAQLIPLGLLLAHHQRENSASCPRFHAGPINDIDQILQSTDLDTVLDAIRREFAAREPLERFYELFLSEYDRGLRRRRGVFYTPDPIVSYILRGVARLLEGEFAGDLHHRPLRVIDPACGSGTFLSAAEEFGRVFESAQLLGFDILPAACAVAKLLQSGQAAPRPNAVQFHCDNPLESGDELADMILGDNALPVIIGNPPYSNFGRQNRSDWIRRLLTEYKVGLEEKKLNLDDDFIKFIRWAQYWIDRAGRGIVAYVTSNTYLHGLTHRGMRQSLCRSFSDIYLLDLAGDISRQRNSPKPDENVFGIRQGVAIGLFVKRPTQHDGRASIHAAEMRGTRHEKFRLLDQTDVESTSWHTFAPGEPQFYFAATSNSGSEYESYPRLDRIFVEYVSGVQTKNDRLYTAMTRQELVDKMQAALVDRQDHPFDAACIRPYMVAPLDVRWVYYDPRLLGRARWQTMRHMLHGNVGLVFMRQSTGEGPYDHFLLTRTLVSDRVFYSTRGAPFLAPLYLYGGSHETTDVRNSNLESAFVEEFTQRLNSESLGRRVTPLMILHYAYALFHSQAYRRRYDDQLRVDFPRLPWTRDKQLFVRLSKLGRSLADLHLFPTHELGAPIEGRHTTAPIAPGYPKLVAHNEGPSGDVLINQDRKLLTVDRQDWEFHIGGYAVVSRWLKQRRGRRLTTAEQQHARCLAALARKTRQISAEIDQLVGSWPIR